MGVRQILTLVTVATAALMAHPAIATTDSVARQDFRVTTADGVGIFVRELRPLAAASDREPLILVHGARVPGLGSFDLPVPGGSVAADLAQRTGRTAARTAPLPWTHRPVPIRRRRVPSRSCAISPLL